MSLLSFCEAQQPWLLETIDALVRLESPSTDKAAVDRCGDYVARTSVAMGGRVQRLRREAAGDHVRAEFGRGTRQVLLLGHFDTVWPVGQIETMSLRVDRGRLYGPGVFDMKAGLAIGLLATRALVERTHSCRGRITMLWTADEETGSATSRGIIEDEARHSDAVLVLEPALPDGAVKTRRKGCGEFLLKVGGVAAHAGIEPGRGASATYELARQIRVLEALQDPARGVSINVGILGGGSRTNVVAAEAWASLDVRVDTMVDAARVDAAIRALSPEIPGTTVTVSGAIDRPPLERTPAVEHLYMEAKGVAAALGRTLGEGRTGGGSDGNLTAALGVPTLDGLGAVGAGAHALDEHVTVGDLCWRAALVAGLIQRILDS